MAEEKFVLMNLEDAKSKELAQIISSDTARKILSLLADKPLSETDISNKLNIPLPTAHYNTQQLLKANIIEIKDFLWSERGKKIQLYQLSNKLIIITPRGTQTTLFSDKLKEIIPAAIGGFLVSIGIYAYQLFNQSMLKTTDHEFSGIIQKSIPETMFESSIADTALTSASNTSAPMQQAITTETLTKFSNLPNYALWFLLGVIFTIILYTLVSYMRRKK